MQHSTPNTITLDDIVITEELSRRTPRSPNWEAESQAMRSLASQLVHAPEVMLQSLVDLAVELCHAGTAGVSLLETTPEGDEIFRWVVLAGTMAHHHMGGYTPRTFSPCGVCLEQGTPVLFAYPERYFTYFQEAETPVVEGLVMPLVAEGNTLGTVWVMSHDEQRRFDPEDVRLMAGLADLTAAALLRNQQHTQELLAANARLEAEVIERKLAEERALALMENLPGGAVFVVDRDLRYRLAKGEALLMAGFKPEDFIGRTMFEALPPELAANYESLYRKALAGEPFEYEHQANDRWYITRSMPLRAEDGEIYEVLAVFYDITDRKQAEAAIAADLRDTQRLRDLSARLIAEDDIQTLYQEILSVAITLLDADAGTVQILDDATQELILLVTQGFDLTMTGHFSRVNARSNTPCGRALATGDRTFIDFDVPESEDPDGSLRMHVEAGYRSAQSTPLITRSGKSIGIVSTHWRQHHRPSDRQLRFLDLLVRQAADLIEQRQAEAALRESEERNRVLFDSIDEGVCLFERLPLRPDGLRDYRYVAMNPAMQAMFGIPDLSGQSSRDNFPDEVEDWYDDYDRVLETGQPIRVERETEPQGMVLDMFVTRVEDGSGERLLAVMQDVTERKRQELALRESEEKFRLLFNAIDEGFCIMEVVANDRGEITDLYFHQVNQTFEQQTGLSNVVGKTVGELLPNFEQHWIDIYQHVWETGESRRDEHYVADVDRWYRVHHLRIGDAGSPFVAVVFEDISDRKRAEDERKRTEERQAFLLKFSDALRAEPDADAVTNRAIQMLSEQMRLDRCYIGVYRLADDRGDFTHQVGNERVPPLPDEVRLSDFPDALRVAFDRTLVIDDIVETEGLTDTDRRNLGALGLRALVAATLRKGENNPLGSIVAVSARPRHWTRGEVALVEEVAERTWAAVERARAEAALRESEAKYRSLFTTMDQGFCIIEKVESLEGQPSDFRYLTVNPAFEHHTGMPNVVGKTIRECVPNAEHYIMDIYDDVVRTRQPQQFEHYVSALDRWIAANVFPAQQPGQIAVLFSNISDRKRAEADRIRLIQAQAARQEEQQRAETLAELNRAKTLFFCNVSHEFRTPLTLLLGPLEDAIAHLEAQSRESAEEPSSPHSPIPPSPLQDLYLARRNALCLLKLVNTLLDFSRIEAGRMEAVYEPTDLATFTAELSSVFRSAIERAGLQLIVNCPPLPEPVFVDREMWEKIVLNLLSNAFKFTFEGEIQVNLSVDGEEGDGVVTTPSLQHVVLEIRDTGTGIAPEHLPHLFERFYQIRGTQTRTHEGSGIGLALVYELVQLQGGTIEVSSTLGEGTCFTITLPFGTDHLPSDRIASPQENCLQRDNNTTLPQRERQPIRPLASTAIEATFYEAAAERWLPEEGNRKSGIGNWEEPSPSTADSARVLLVDDNADMREYLTRLLSDYVQVEAVADGTTVLAIAQERVPDLILSDVMMPSLNGFELLQALRADPRTREIPIILLSARAGEEAIVEGLEAGADDYLIKPFSAQELVSRVTAHLQMAQLRGEALQQARSINRRKDEFISIVSHELNTPLVSILGWTRLLRSNPPSPAILSKALGTIERNATLQAQLVQDLLDLSRITTSKLHLNLQPIDLTSVIEMAIATVTQSAADKGIHLSWHKTIADPVVVMGDGDRLSQVLINLLINAIKFTPELNSATLQLSVTKSDDTTDLSYAEIRVTDTGRGIAADFLPHVFDQFRQAEGGKTTKGLGLGLAIARHIVECHQGTIEAFSEGEGKGTTFTVRLPLLTPHRP